MRGNKEAKQQDEGEASVLCSVEFIVNSMKVLPCSKRFCHDWTVCPFAHPGEKARRRDPRLFTYTGIACPDMKKDQSCLRGDACPYAHNVFEYWLHPTRYRTQLCNDGPNCTRRICFFAHSLEELRVPANKPFVPPEALAAASVTAALKAAEKAIAASSDTSPPGKGGRGGGKAEASGVGGGSAELSKHLGALQVAAGQHVSSRSAQEERRVIEVLTSLLRTYEAPVEGAPATSPSRRASCDLPVHPRTLQQRGGGNGGGNGNGSGNGAGGAAGGGAQDDRLPINQGRTNSDPAHRGRGRASRASTAQTRRSLDYGMQRAVAAHTVDENALFLEPMAEQGGLLGAPATSQGLPAFSPTKLASAWAAAQASGAAAAPAPAPRDWGPAPDFGQGAPAADAGAAAPPGSASDLLAQLQRLQQSQAMERALSGGAAGGGRRGGRRGGGGGAGTPAQAALQAHLALLNQHAAAHQAASAAQQQQAAMQQAVASAAAAAAHAGVAARGAHGEGVARAFAGPALAEPGGGGGLPWPWEQPEGMDASGGRRQSTDSSRLSVDSCYRMSGDYGPSADYSARASFESMQGMPSHDLGDFARTFDASQRYSVDSMRSATPPATPGAFHGGHFGSLFAFSGPYGAGEPPAAEAYPGGWGAAPGEPAHSDALPGGAGLDPSPVGSGA